MKLVSFRTADDNERLGLYHNENVYDLHDGAKALGLSLPPTMNGFLWQGDKAMDLARKVQEAAAADKIKALDSKNLTMLPPVPHPASCRDAYAFRQHVATARRNRGVAMIPEFDQFPIFYFTNHNAIIGAGDLLVEADHLHKLDFELEVAAVIGRKGRNVQSKDADAYIAGYTIMNDFSARVLQMEEMKLNLGPAKGKDFATAIGPWLVTVDELADRRIKTEFGDKYDLRMTACHNDNHISDGNMKDMNWTFAEIIERCAYGADIFPGDVIGSGTVGTGCYLELNGSWSLEAKERREEFTPVWLEDGDTIELGIEGLGSLRNRIVRNKQDYSILAKKKLVEEPVS
ncbi:MAG: fumarylacetoacetate hydrolase family protein [Bacteroidetes bacterium]|nr:fumarylacetoacetate hydrolase family protein [Bacteroidota bacterium]